MEGMGEDDEQWETTSVAQRRHVKAQETSALEPAQQ